MDYQNKYLKYKNKYLELKKKQYGAGPNSHIGLDDRILPYIGTYNETKENRELREARNIPPPNGYTINNSIYEIIRLNHSNYTNEYYNLLQQNLNNLFGDSFEIINNRHSELLYIDVKGNGNCFLNCLYIYSIMTGKAHLINELYSIALGNQYIDFNFDNFKQSMLNLSDSYLDSKINDIGEEEVLRSKNELREENTPTIIPFIMVYVNNFNTGITILNVIRNYQFNNIQYFTPDFYTNNTDNMIIIQTGNSHFRLLIPLENSFNLRQDLANYLHRQHRQHIHK